MEKRQASTNLHLETFFAYYKIKLILLLVLLGKKEDRRKEKH